MGGRPSAGARRGCENPRDTRPIGCVPPTSDARSDLRPSASLARTVYLPQHHATHACHTHRRPG
eukprot:2663712-Pleurochrysis_carterae.AAC.1